MRTSMPNPETRGTARGVDRRVLALALPATASLLAKPLYDLTDTAILGHLGTTPLAGAVIATEILLLASSVFIFLMFGTTAAVARLSGGGRPAEAAHQGVQGMWLGAGLGVVVALLLAALLPVLIPVWGGDGEVADAARTYGWISLLGFPAFLMGMAGTGYVRGTSDTVTPLWIALGSVVLNLAVELTTVYGLGWGVAASAGSTVLAQWVAAIAYLVIVRQAARRHGMSLRPDRRTLRGLGSTGVPLFVRTAALRGTMATSVALAGRLGTTAVAGYGVAFGIWSFLAYLSDGLEVAGQVLVAETLGQGDAARARQVAWRILRMALLVGVVAGAVVLAARTGLPHLFTGDPAVAAAAASGLWWVAVAQPLNSVVFAADGILVGADDLRYLALAMVGAAVVYAASAGVVVATDAPVAWVWAALVGFMAARGVGLGLRLRSPAWSAPTGSR